MNKTLRDSLIKLAFAPLIGFAYEQGRRAGKLIRVIDVVIQRVPASPESNAGQRARMQRIAEELISEKVRDRMPGRQRPGGSTGSQARGADDDGHRDG